MQVLVVSWIIWSITKDPLMLGMVGLAEAIPAIGAALPMGYIVDKAEKKGKIKLALSIIVASAIGTGILVQPAVLSVVGSSLSVTLLLALVLVNGVARSIYSPAMFTALSATVPLEYLPRATALSSATWQGAMMLGPMAGGLLYGSCGVGWTAVVTVSLMLIGAAGVRYLPTMPAIVSASKGSLKADVVSGLRFILGNQIIVGALSLDLFAVLFGGAVALLPVFADTILHVDAKGLGFLRAAPSVGSVLMMAWLSLHPPNHRVGKLLLVAVASFGVATICFALSTSFVASLVILLLLGSVDAVSVVIRHTILQLHTPDDMRGRVASANTMFISSSNEIGAIESGVAARLMGTVPSVVFGGAMTLLVVAITAFKAPLLRKLDRLQA